MIKDCTVAAEKSNKKLSEVELQNVREILAGDSIQTSLTALDLASPHQTALHAANFLPVSASRLDWPRLWLAGV